MNQVAILNKKISVREELIAVISQEIRNLNKQINTNQKEIEDLKRTMEILKSDYAKMVYFAYRNKDSYNRLMYLFAASDFNQAFQRMRYMQQINEYRKKKAEIIVSTQDSLLAKIESLKQKKEEKRQLLTSEESEKLNLSKEKTEHEGVLVQLQEKEKQLKQELEQKRRETEALNAAIKRIIQEEIKRQAEEAKKNALASAKRKEELEKKKKEGKVIKDKKAAETNTPSLTETAEANELSSDFSSNKGKLPWPVLKGVITDPFGEHEHPTIKGFMVNNNGVEITTQKGSQARAIFEGVVTGVTAVPGSGKVVIIRHGEYLSVYSNLSEVSVKTGDKISMKQGIGTVAYNEDESKSAIGLQIWRGQKILNPEEWLYR